MGERYGQKWTLTQSYRIRPIQAAIKAQQERREIVATLEALQRNYQGKIRRFLR